MFSYIWPIGLVVLSNIVYHICEKSIPDGVNPFASLTVTYLIGAAFSAILFFCFGNNANLLKEITKLNWAPFVLGLFIVGLEVGYIYVYKAGWAMSSASTVQSAFLAVALVVVGFLLYHEKITWNKIVGIGVCLVGLALINLK